MYNFCSNSNFSYYHYFDMRKYKYDASPIGCMYRIFFIEFHLVLKMSSNLSYIPTQTKCSHSSSLQRIVSYDFRGSK